MAEPAISAVGPICQSLALEVHEPLLRPGHRTRRGHAGYLRELCRVARHWHDARSRRGKPREPQGVEQGSADDLELATAYRPGDRPAKAVRRRYRQVSSILPVGSLPVLVPA